MVGTNQDCGFPRVMTVRGAPINCMYKSSVWYDMKCTYINDSDFRGGKVQNYLKMDKTLR
jgi:hypothetical protein